MAGAGGIVNAAANKASTVHGNTASGGAGRDRRRHLPHLPTAAQAALAVTIEKVTQQPADMSYGKPLANG